MDNKTTVLIFFGGDGNAAKALAKTIRNGRTYAFIRQIYAFTGEDEGCDRVIAMPDVDGDGMARIIGTYGDKVERQDGAKVEAPKLAKLEPTEFYAKHRGKGRWYVMKGDEIISGPYAKDDVAAAVVRESELAKKA